jgi:hypothetical protein
MKLFIDFNDEKRFIPKLKDIEHIDFSLFLDCSPKNKEELSSINILVLVEPNEYFGLHDWAIQNKNLFSFILTYNDKVLNNCENAVYLPFGFTFLKEEHYQKEHNKEFKLSHLCGILNKSYGHSMRHEILARENEFKISTNFYKTIGDRHNLETVGNDKETVFGNSQYGVVIENFSHRGYFSEKLIDCFLLKTIPIYWGCSNIYNYFYEPGFFKFENVDDLIYISNMLTPEMYELRKDAIEHNYQLALNYTNNEQRVVDKIVEIFKLNNLI